MSPTPSSDKLDRSARLRWVRLADMKVSPIVQREKLDDARVERIARDFDPDKFDAPKCNLRDGTYWIIDGWHRTEAARIALGPDQAVQSWVRENLSDEEAAEWSIGLNDYRRWSAFDSYRIAVVAGREVETDVDRIVRACGLMVTRDKGSGAVRAVGTLVKVYKRNGARTLSRTLGIIRDAYGDAGLEAPVIDGVAHLCARYNGELDNAVTVRKLADAHGGVNGLLNKAESLRRSTGNHKAVCVAAAAVEIVKVGKDGKRLPSWWKADA